MANSAQRTIHALEDTKNAILAEHPPSIPQPTLVKSDEGGKWINFDTCEISEYGDFEQMYTSRRYKCSQPTLNFSWMSQNIFGEF